MTRRRSSLNLVEPARDRLKVSTLRRDLHYANVEWRFSQIETLRRNIRTLERIQRSGPAPFADEVLPRLRLRVERLCGA